MTPNTTVLERCEISGVEAFLIAAQLRWAGHVIRMDDQRIPKRVFYSQLAHGSRTSGGQMKRYKDTLKVNLKACDPNRRFSLLSWTGTPGALHVMRLLCDLSPIELVYSKRSGSDAR